MKNIKITDFARRHFKKEFKGTKILDKTPKEVESLINKLNPIKSIDGYADFCKLLVFDNFTNAKPGTIEITDDIKPYIKSGYKSRNENELAILSRWVKLPYEVKKANYLIFVVYSKKQLIKESKDNSFDGDWGVVAILGQNNKDEEPMKPETMFRNALGVEEGGSGVKIDREKYKKSVKFWENNINIE